MNLEEAVRRSLGENCAEVFVLEACAGQTGDRVSRKAEQARGFRVRKFEHRVHGLLRFPSGRCLRCSERTGLAARHLGGSTGAVLDELPGIALKIGGRGALARRSRSRRTIILALERDAETLF